MYTSSIKVILENGKRPWDAREFDAVHHITDLVMTALPDGTLEGNPTVAFCIEVENEEGETSMIVAEATLAVMLTSLDIVVAMYGDPRVVGGGASSGEVEVEATGEFTVNGEGVRSE